MACPLVFRAGRLSVERDSLQRHAIMDTPTLCVQGIKDGVRRGALEAEFEAFGRLVRVDIVPGNARRGVPDSRIAFVEFERKEDARKAMQTLNGRYVQGKCVMIQFARGAPGMRLSGPPQVRRGTPEPIPQCAALAAKYRHSAGALAAKFPQSGERSRSRSRLRLSKVSGKRRDKDRSDSRERCRTNGKSKAGSRKRDLSRSGTASRGHSGRRSQRRSQKRSNKPSRGRNSMSRSKVRSKARSRSRSRAAKRSCDRSRGRGCSRNRSRDRSRHGRSPSRKRPRRRNASKSA